MEKKPIYHVMTLDPILATPQQSVAGVINESGFSPGCLLEVMEVSVTYEANNGVWLINLILRKKED